MQISRQDRRVLVLGSIEDHRARKAIEAWHIKQRAPHCISQAPVCLLDREIGDLEGTTGTCPSRVRHVFGSHPYDWSLVVSIFCSTVSFFLYVSNQVQVLFTMQLVCVFGSSFLCLRLAQLLFAEFKKKKGREGGSY